MCASNRSSSPHGQSSWTDGGCRSADVAPDTGETSALWDIMSGAMLPEGGSKAASVPCLREAQSRVFVDAFEGERGGGGARREVTLSATSRCVCRR